MFGITTTIKFVQKIDAGRKTAEAVDALMPALALMFESEAKRNTPVQTGRLMNAMKGQKTGYLTAELSNNVEYAPFVEFGTSRMEPRAMIRNAAETMKEKGLAFLKEKLTSKIL
jgi:HK97 gp10 family phage protein